MGHSHPTVEGWARGWSRPVGTGSECRSRRGSARAPGRGLQPPPAPGSGGPGRSLRRQLGSARTRAAASHFARGVRASPKISSGPSTSASIIPCGPVHSRSIRAADRVGRGGRRSSARQRVARSVTRRRPARRPIRMTGRSPSAVTPRSSSPSPVTRRSRWSPETSTATGCVLDHLDAQRVREVGLGPAGSRPTEYCATASRSASSRTCSVVMSRAAASSAPRTRAAVARRSTPVTSTSRTATSDGVAQPHPAAVAERAEHGEREQQPQRQRAEARRAQARAGAAAPGECRVESHRRRASTRRPPTPASQSASARPARRARSTSPAPSVSSTSPSRSSARR